MVRQGAFSNSLAHEQRLATDELLALRGVSGEAAGYKLPSQDLDLRDEAGFITDDTNPLVYIPERDAEREDGIEFEVVHTRIAIRQIPSIEGRVLGAFEKGDRVQLFESDESGRWRRLHYRLRGGWGCLVEAWVLLHHEELGWLLKRSGSELEAAEASLPGSSLQGQAPQAEVDPLGTDDRTAAAASLASSAGQRLRLISAQELPETVVIGEQEQFEVVRRPFIAVRSQPRMDGPIVTTVEFGEHVDTFGEDESGLWRKVFCVCTTAGHKVQEQAVKQLCSSLLPAWMLLRHQDLGALLRSVDTPGKEE